MSALNECELRWIMVDLSLERNASRLGAAMIKLIGVQLVPGYY